MKYSNIESSQKVNVNFTGEKHEQKMISLQNSTLPSIKFYWKFGKTAPKHSKISRSEEFHLVTRMQIICIPRKMIFIPCKINHLCTTLLPPPPLKKIPSFSTSALVSDFAWFVTNLVWNYLLRFAYKNLTNF